MENVKKVLGNDVFWKLKFFKERVVQNIVKGVNVLGLNIFPTKNFYSPLPLIGSLEHNKDRWCKPSALEGLAIDLQENERLLCELVDSYRAEYQTITPFDEAKTLGFGPGYSYVDSITTYAMLRKIQPKTYLEVGSGLSTFYASKALAKNAKNSKIICVEPYPYAKLNEMTNINIIQKEVQSLQPEYFDILEENDVLFIDSTHIVKIDGDVPFLFLDVLPRLKKGVYIHIHDIHFPYNIPYPPEFWVFKRGFPMYWTEAMLLQAFLAFNDHFEILLSTPLIRFHNEELLKNKIPNYVGVDGEPNTFSSLWIKKVK